jgi:hypothetical protein
MDICKIVEKCDDFISEPYPDLINIAAICEHFFSMEGMVNNGID